MSGLWMWGGVWLLLGIPGATPETDPAAERRIQEAKRAAAALEEKIAALEKRIQAAESRGIDACGPRVSLTVGRLFVKFLPGDAARSVEDYPRDMIDYRILGKEEAWRRIRELATFEAQETARVLDRAIAETQRLLADPAANLKVPAGAARHVRVRDGAFWSGGRRVFLSGILGLPFRSDSDQQMEMAKNLGANLLGPVSVRHTPMRGWNDFDDSYFEQRIYPLYRAAEKHGFLVNPSMWNYRAPAWLAKEAPDINLREEEGWFRDNMDLDHPLTERFNRTWFRYAAARMKDLPNNFCYSLMGEEWCRPQFRGKYTARRYENWLREKHKTIDSLNRAWGTAYPDFAAAAARESLNTQGGFYDWYTFNEERLTRFNQSQIDGLKESEPQGLWTCWPAAGCLVSAPLGGFDPHYGRNREDILRQSSVSGWDGGMFAVEAGPSTRRLPESHWAKYNLGWRDDMIYYDFAKSVSPEKPIFDPELHSITSVYHISPLGVSADYFRTSLWMEHLHGLGAHLLWWWGRNEDGQPRYGEFLGGLLTQPQLLDVWGRTVLELRRLTDHVALFPQLERQARILYCEPSAIHEPDSYPLEVRDAYEALYFLDCPVGFVTARMLREQGLAGCRLLVIPGGKYASDEVVAAVRKYRQGGGKVAVLGKEPLKCDEYGKERNLAGLLDSLALTGSTPEEYWPQLDKLLDDAGIERPVRLAGKDGKPVWGVELRVARKGEHYIASLVNLTHKPAEIVLRSVVRLGPARDLIAGQTIPLQAPLTLEPRRPMLLELAPSMEARQTSPHWLARPAHTEPRILEWARKHPDLVSLETQKTYGGHTAYAITVTNRRIDEGKKVHVLFSQPHAHEPAATAGMMNFLSQLIEGTHLDGRPSSLPRQAWLDRCLITFLPDGNPDGRARAPEDWWDGTKYSNREFLDFAFGRQADGQRCPRLGRWSTRQQQPALIGFVYEQINEHEYVEPNRDRDSTFFRLLARMLAQRQYALHVDLHQTEFEKSEHNAMIILPCVQNELPPPIRQRNVELARAIMAAWQAGGGRPVPEAKPLGYGEDQLRYFRQCWGDIYRSVPHVTVEIQNNNVRTPPTMQQELMEMAMRAAIEFALDKARPPGEKG